MPVREFSDRLTEVGRATLTLVALFHRLRAEKQKGERELRTSIYYSVLSDHGKDGPVTPSSCFHDFPHHERLDPETVS